MIARDLANIDKPLVLILDDYHEIGGIEGGYTPRRLDMSFGPLVTALAGLLTVDDAKAFAAAMEPQSSMALMLFENTWAGPFVEAVRNANGKIVMNERIPRAIVEKLAAESAA